MANIIKTLESSDRNPCFFLWIAGVDVLYGSVVPPDRLYSINDESGSYRKKRAIIPNRGFRFHRKLDIESHVIDATPVKVVLACADKYDSSTSSTDPANVLGRFGYEGSSFVYMHSTASILNTDNVPLTVTVRENPTTKFAVNDIVHIGREAFRISAMDAAAKTITFDARALLGTVPASHLSFSETDVSPVITDRPVFVKGRRAIIFEADGTAEPNDLTWVERWRGFVPHEPEFGTEGELHTLTVTVSPLTSMLDVALGDKNSSLQLKKGFHTFGSDADPNIGIGLAGTNIDCYHEIAEGDLFKTSTGLDPQIVADYFEDGDSCLPGKAASAVARHQEICGNEFKNYQHTEHPRAIPLCHSGDNTPLRVIAGFTNRQLEGQAAVNDVDVFDVSGYNAADTSIAARFLAGGNLPVSPAAKPEAGVPKRFAFPQRTAQNSRAGYWRNVSIVDAAEHPDNGNPAPHDWPQTLAWPRALEEAINETGQKAENFGWNVGHEQNRGAWVRIRLNMDDRRDPFLILDNNMDGPVSVIFASGDVPDLQRINADDGLHPQASFRRMDTDTALEQRHSIVNRMQHSVFRLGDENGQPETIRLEANDRNIAYTTKIAETFYQEGEGYILTDKRVLVPAGGNVMLEARQGGELLNTFKINNCTQITVDGQTLFRCQLDNIFNRGSARLGRLQTMAQHIGDEPIQLEYSATFNTQNLGEICLNLLTSQGGNQIGGVYDVLSHGAGMMDSSSSHLGLQGTTYINGSVDIDAASFLQIDSPIPNAVYNPVWRNGDTVYDVLTSLLRTAGYVIDIRTDQAGRCRLAAIPLGFPTRTNVVADITESDIAAKPAPASPAQLDIFNSFNFLFNHDVDDEPQGEQKVRDQVSIDTFGQEEILDIELPGVQLADDLEIIHQLRPMFQRLRFDLAYPRRLWRLEAKAGLAVSAEIGGAYSVTHPLLRPHQGLGVVNELGRLRSVTHDGWRPSCKMEFVYYGTEGTGWGPSLEVDNVSAQNALVVKENSHTAERHPRTGDDIEDLTPFDIGAAVYLTAGATVLLSPAGDMDNVQAMTISDVNTATNTITFTANHTLGIGSSGHQVVPMASPIGTVAQGFQKYAVIGQTVLS